MKDFTSWPDWKEEESFFFTFEWKNKQRIRISAGKRPSRTAFSKLLWPASVSDICRLQTADCRLTDTKTPNDIINNIPAQNDFSLAPKTFFFLFLVWMASDSDWPGATIIDPSAIFPILLSVAINELWQNCRRVYDGRSRKRHSHEEEKIILGTSFCAGKIASA